MLTLFTTLKPCRDLAAIIQENALSSWQRLGPSVETLILGDDEGASSAAARHGYRHYPEIPLSDERMPLVSGLIATAEREARHELLAYCNADIILFPGFLEAVEILVSRFKRFLMVGQRLNLDVTTPIDFSNNENISRFIAEARHRGALEPTTGIDYFVFPRGLFGKIPPLEIGRFTWDQWLVGRAARQGVIVDATSDVMAIHQNHGYGRTPSEAEAIMAGLPRILNRRRAKNDPLLTIEDANYSLIQGKIIPRPWNRSRLRNAVLRRSDQLGPLRLFWRGIGSAL